jgi:hypothetical protein
MSAVLDTITGTELGNPGAHSTVVKLDDAEHASSLARGPLRTAVPCIALRLNKHGNTAVYGVEPDSDLIGKVAPGDVVVKVDGRPTEARTPAEVRELLAGACPACCAGRSPPVFEHHPDIRPCEILLLPLRHARLHADKSVSR